MQISVDGLRVVEAESFAAGDVEAARVEGAQLLWVLLPEGRSADAYASLLMSACAELGPGPADLDSWGDAEETIEAYEDLGFDVVVRVQGWELEL
jgi:hypothetical protein